MICPACRTEGAYVGFVKIECPNAECQHYTPGMPICLTVTKPKEPVFNRLALPGPGTQQLQQLRKGLKERLAETFKYYEKPTLEKLAEEGAFKDPGGHIRQIHSTPMGESRNHGFKVGQVVCEIEDKLVLARADNIGKARSIGVVDEVTSDHFSVVITGKVSCYENLNPGQIYFVSAREAGGLTQYQPAGVGEYVRPILIAKTDKIGFVPITRLLQCVREGIWEDDKHG